ncbi:hypothetical protein SMACR_09666 [Sordaria macrospora]|uniref:WGS project CABT00000000 data, contig 2.77 n=2 Tax=Sordaria macrospora TaxID=5147 RepID=F7WBI3_SORMK|nr:uncharacterized protein SMAC_09666 [Sordaria macrospora k-hell]KAA8635575.1 hypothetical protein SMACR_09666 [Sordaria macrospora]WPJ66320.1 hypothetical protein SMAC4_09666 [Sordaria macrospora]CCC05442.1 unnamed protein product [Sordaria macrospora k-hell]
MNPYNYHGTDGSHNPENDRDIHDGMEPPNSTPSRPPVASHLTQMAPCLASATQSHLPYDLYYTSVGQQNGLHHGFNGPGQAHGMIHAEMPQSLSAQQALWRNHNAQWVGRSQQAATPFLSMAPSIPANAYAQTSMPTMGPMTAAIDSGNHPQPLQQRGMSQPWSRAQDDLLLTLKMEGKTHADVCSALQRRFGVLRTPNVVAKRLTKLHNEVLSREDVGKCLENVLETALSMINDEFSNRLGRQILPTAGDTQKLKRTITGFYQRQLVLAERSAGEAGGSEMEANGFEVDSVDFDCGIGFGF